jgi:hypothetical protein
MHQFLRLTNATLIISLLYFYFFSEKNWCEIILASMLVITIGMSQTFWSNPVKGSDIHVCDAIIAKLTILSFVVYTLWKHGFMIPYIIVLIFIAISFYHSHHYSSMEWCSNEHIKSHGLLHYFCFMATFFAFI